MGDIATPTVQSSKDATPEVDPDDRRKNGPRTPEQEQKGLYPPRNTGRSTRMIGEVVVDLGLADRETGKAGPRASCSWSAASCATTSSRESSPSASAWTSSTSRSTTSTWAPST